MARSPRSRSSLAVALVAAAVVGLSTFGTGQAPAQEHERKVEKTDAEWRKALTPDQYFVTRMKGTEPPFTGRYARGHFKGIFTCVGCGAELFSSAHKFESGTGWPSFYRPARADAIETEPDYSGPEPRVEVTCVDCGAHLGHVFADGPAPTGQRYCINSVALKLKPFPAAATASKTAKAKTKAPAKPKAKAETKATAKAETKKKAEAEKP